MHVIPLPKEEGAMSNVTVTDHKEPLGRAASPAPAGYPLGFQASVAGLLALEILLGLSSNLTVLALYCLKSNLISSVSSTVTVNLHVADALVCLCCIPLTIAVVLLPPEGEAALLRRFHEACVSFAGVATAANVLAITLDRYDISVKPANRVLTARRALALMAAVWLLSFVSFLVPFGEVGFFGPGRARPNQTLGERERERDRDRERYRADLGLYYHLLAQIPIFFFTAVVMLITYSKILQALNIRIGTRFHASQKKKARRKKRPCATAMTPRREATEASQSGGDGGGGDGGSGDGGGGDGRNNPSALGMRASVSVIIALRRAVKRHRERRERQRRVFRMSLLIVSTFLLCWTPITVLNALILSLGPSDLMVKLRLGFLVMAYGTTVFHPLLYAFTRQKFQKVLKSKMKKRVVSIVEADATPNNAVIRNSWIDPKRSKKVTFQDKDARRKGPPADDAQ